MTTPQPESEAGLRADEPVGPDLPLPVHPLETALVPPSAPGPGTAPTLGASDLAELNDGPDRAPAPGPHGGLQAGAAHSVATGTPMVQKDGTAGSRSVAFPAGRAEAAPIQLDMDAPAAPGAPPLLEAAVPGLPGPRQPYLPVTAPAAAPTSGTPEPVAAPPSAVSAHFELTTDAAHGRPEEYEPSRPTEDVSPEPGGTEAAPTLGVALNVQATSAFDDPPDDERQVVEPYAPPLGALHTPASVAPAPSETGISSPPAALFSAPSEVGSGPEPTPHRARSIRRRGRRRSRRRLTIFLGPGFLGPGFSVPASRSRPPQSRRPRSRRSPLPKARSPAEKGGPRRTCSGWSFRNGKELTWACLARERRASLVPPTLRLRRLATALSALPAPCPASRLRGKRTRPARMRPPSAAQLPFRQAGNRWTCQLLLVRGRLRWSVGVYPTWSSPAPNGLPPPNRCRLLHPRNRRLTRATRVCLGATTPRWPTRLGRGGGSPATSSSPVPYPCCRPRQWCKEPRRPRPDQRSGQPFNSRSRVPYPQRSPLNRR